MRAGPRDTLIIIERFTATEDEYGGQIEDWAPLAEEYAEVIYGRGEERRAAAQEQASLAATFRVPANDRTITIKTTDRVNFAGIWDISSAVPRGRDGIEITATRPA